MSIAFLTRAYNAEPFLEQCVQRVLDQRNAELLYFLCDNGSTDGTAALIRSFAARDSRIRSSTTWKEACATTSTSVPCS